MFAMDVIAKIVAAVVVILIGICISLGVQVTMLKFQIRDLTTEKQELMRAVESCKTDSSRLNESNDFLQKKLKILDSYYKRKPKPPAVSGGKLEVDNLFTAEPR